MTREKLIEIFEQDSQNWEGDNAFKGLQIISNYTDRILEAAEHDIIYSCCIDSILDKLTIRHATELRNLNWMIHDNHFACFV